MATKDSIANVIIGIDVGGTNTDAVILHVTSFGQEVLASAKHHTTRDITTGVCLAVIKVITNFFQKRSETETECYTKLNIQHINIGTTHFVNALVEKRNLVKVAVIRLCGQSSRAIFPFADFPAGLKDCINGGTYFANGGYEYDGREIFKINQLEIEDIIETCKQNGIHNFVICGVFSTICKSQEIEVENIVKQCYQNFNDDKTNNDRVKPSISLSHEFGYIGLLERENTAILNECLKPLCMLTIDALQESMKNLKICCPLFLTQNDGTILEAELAKERPVCMLSSGPTNSMRGAAFLSQKQNAIIVDIGGTTTDVGMIHNGFPRVASTEVKIAEIRTNFHMPDVYSFGLGGGSYVWNDKSNGLCIGPRSAGYNIQKEAFVFSKQGTLGRKLTATDIAVAHGNCEIGNKDNLSDLETQFVNDAIQIIHEKLEVAIDMMKLSSSQMDVILVGGGSILIDTKNKISGVNITKCKHADVANAVGAALSQVSGDVDVVSDLTSIVMEDKSQTNDDIVTVGKSVNVLEIDNESLVKAREIAIRSAECIAILNCEKRGGNKDTIAIVEKRDTPLSYLPGNATRIEIKVIGDLHFKTNVSMPFASVPEHFEEILKNTEDVEGRVQTYDSKGGSLEMSTSHPEKQNLTINKSNGVWILNERDIDCITIGAGILGCGGGGSPYIGNLLAKDLIKRGHEIKVVSSNYLKNVSHPLTDLILPVGLMGAPLVSLEKLVNKEPSVAVQGLTHLLHSKNYNSTTNSWSGGKTDDKLSEIILKENETESIKYFDKLMSCPDLGGFKTHQIGAVVSAEIGGMNSVVPLIVAAELNLLVLDADGMGRAFPELQMFTPLIYEIDPYPATLADDKGRIDVVLKTSDGKSLENHFRKTVIEMGCVAGVVINGLSIEKALKTLVPNSLSRAWLIGNAVLMARLDKTDPVDAILAKENGVKIFCGKIMDIRISTTDGFNKGQVTLEGLDLFNKQTAVIDFQNENLVARISDAMKDTIANCIACVPDLITIVDKETGTPIPTEGLKYGQRVTVLVLPSHPLLRTEQALKFVGPRAFGYNVEFKPLNEINRVQSLAD